MAGRIFITGATSPLGRRVVQYLAHTDREIRVAVHTHAKEEYVKMTGVQTVPFEYGDFATIDRALEGVETLFLLTPIAREQVEFTRRIIDRAQLWGVSHIVKISMMGVDDFPGIQFTRWHKQSEIYIEKSGIAYTFIRPNAMMQNFVRYVQPAGSFIYLPLDDAAVSYIDMRDVARFCAEVILRAQEFQGCRFELTGPQALTPEDIAMTITKAVGYHISYIDISEETSLHVLESTGMAQWLAKGFVELYSLQRSGRFGETTTDFEKIIQRKPHTFEAFVRDYSNIFKAIIQQEHHTFLR
ncbi:NmrA family NAD(P)-binding protein [Chitinispirillales bacterium ANBcel5]|uniref:NmrA family NAD(P)-binding protein n=1 Tax=Cellulosispirillum alkaliphilum TaxID=3039283 RepID=UPI002A4EFF0B|nr:NmrA family NAD(P)-binding protein [Chitinispirillales bacterium ANBcel5]